MMNIAVVSRILRYPFQKISAKVFTSSKDDDREVWNGIFSSFISYFTVHEMSLNIVSIKPLAGIYFMSKQDIMALSTWTATIQNKSGRVPLEGTATSHRSVSEDCDD